MAKRQRQKFLRIMEWNNYVEQIRQNKVKEPDLYGLRRACYKDIEALRGRPLLVYAVKTQDVPTIIMGEVSISQADVDGFIDLVDSVGGDGDSVDVILHSPGGSPEATERIVALLRTRFGHVSFLIPHEAYSAATMLALSGNEIIMHPAATLGPIDPQLNGIPARSIRRGFDKVKELLKEEGPEALPAYIPLIEKYTLELLELCDDSLKLSQELVSEWLRAYMFGEDAEANELIEKAVTFFSDYDTHKTHGRPLTFEKVKPLGLKVEPATGELKDLLREAHILLSGFFNVSPFVKLYENSDGLSWGRQILINPLHSQPPSESGERSINPALG